MSACEWCWAEANRRAMFGGGSVTDRYYEVMAEQEDMGRRGVALCPLVKKAAEQGEARTRAIARAFLEGEHRP